MTSELDDLQSRIKQARADGVGDAPPVRPAADIQNRNQGVRAGTELVSSMIAGGLLGYGLDHWFDTRPVWFMTCLILGIISGFWSLYRNLRDMGSEVGFSRAERSLQNPEKPGRETQRFSGTSEED